MAIRINYTLTQFKMNDALFRVFVPQESESEHYLTVDPNALVFDGDQVFMRVCDSGGLPHHMIEIAGGSMAQTENEWRELNLKYIEGNWFLRVGGIL